MEDLAISPWENPQTTSQINQFEFRQKTAIKHQRLPLPLKNRCVQTQTNNFSPSPIRRQSLIFDSIPKKQLSSSHHTFYREVPIKRPSKLELKLVAFPIQQTRRQREQNLRFSDKFDAKSKFLNQSFEVIETIFNSELKLVRIFKERPITKHRTVNESSVKQRKQNSNVLRASEALERFGLYMRQNFETTDSKNSKVQRYKDQKYRYFTESKEKLDKLEHINKKQPSSSLLMNKSENLKFHNLDFPDLNKTVDESMGQTKTESWKEQREKSKKMKEREKKLSIEKLENINCFRETTNIFTKLQRKNKVLFNELQKYNLFGLKGLKKKPMIK